MILWNSTEIKRMTEQQHSEPMWPSLVALATIGALHAALPDRLAMVQPRYLLLVLIALLIVPGEMLHRKGKHNFCVYISYTVLAVLTTAMAYSVIILVEAIPKGQIAPQHLLSSAVILWVTNIVVFAAWYWRLDAGGPHKRDAIGNHTEGAFLFPQMQLPDDGKEKWTPRFIDYLFLAFSTSTALSPTDSPVMSRWAKVLMMIQSMIALTIVALLAARAVNIL